MQEYGLIGKTLSHSFSKNYFQKKFKKKNIDYANYSLFELADINAFSDLLEDNKNLLGINVTIPYKNEVIPFLDELDPISESIQAVNTIAILRNGNYPYLKGYNTDVIGFQKSLNPLLSHHHKQALIFGTGGAAKAIAYALKSMGIEMMFVSRFPKKKDKTIAYSNLSKALIDKYKLIINCTPIGMFPNEEDCIPIDFSAIGKKHLVYDLIYNPEETMLLKRSKHKGAITLNGLKMLELQAEKAWEIWQTQLA